MDAMPAILSAHPEVRFLLCGVAEDLARETVIRDEFERRGLTQHVTFLGNRDGDDKIRVWLSASVFVSPSLTEAFPLVIPEAMAAGVPMVVTAVGAIPDHVRDGEDGFLVQVNDHEALAQGVIRLLSEEPLRSRISAHVRARAPEFSVQANATAVSEIIEELAPR
jgi:glycosyltransferase involved in cell wall biosynthesis